MSQQHPTISLFGLPLFTWVTVETPVNDPVMLPSEACFAYIVAGDGQMLAQQPVIKAETGQVILSLCGHTVSRIISEQEGGKVSTIVVHFHRELLQKVYEQEKPRFWKELETPVVNYIVQTAASVLVKQYFQGLIFLFENEAAVNEELLVLKLREIIALLMQTDESPLVLQIINSLFSDRTFTFREVIDAHVCAPVQVEDLAMLTGHSLSAFKREFAKVFGTTPGAYIMDQRAQKLAAELATSDETISRIGYDCGFTSPAHLSRVFKAKFGVSPSDYRLNLTVKE